MKMKSPTTMIPGLYLTLFFAYLFGPLIIMVITAFNSSTFPRVSPWECFTTDWFGKLASDDKLLAGLGNSLLIGVGVVCVAIPIGLATAIYLSEYAKPSVREVVKPVLEILAGIPSVVFGYVAVVAVSPLIRSTFESAGVFNAASASIVVGFMILPMIVSLSEDALRSVPRSLREAAYALGATKLDVIVRVVVPAALSGIVASFLLATSRAIGETMAVTLAAGRTPKMTLNPLESIQTMTAYIVQISQGDTPAGTIEYRTIFAVGLTLFVSTFVVNLLAQLILRRMREKYD